MRKRPKALIVGSGGFVGGYLIKELSLNGYDVCGVDRRDASSHSSELFSYHAVDVADYRAISTVIKNEHPDYLVNLAALSSVGLSWDKPQATMQVNIIGSVNILEACRNNDVDCRIMLIGSSEEYRSSDAALSEVSPTAGDSPYGISKIAQEQIAHLYAEKYSMDVLITRSFNHTGPGQSPNFVLPSFCKQVAILQKNEMPGTINVGNLDVIRDFSDVRDIVRAYRIILERGRSNEIYNVGSEKGYSLRSLLEIITGFSSQDVSIQVDPARVRLNEVFRIVANCSKIHEELGWYPEIEIEKSLEELYESFL